MSHATRDRALRSRRTASRASAGITIAAIVMLLASGCVSTGKKSVVEPTAGPTETAPTGIQDADSSLTSSQIFAGGLYVDPLNHAVAAAKDLKSTSSPEAAAITRISSQPTAVWLGDQISVSRMTPLLATYVADAKSQSKTLFFVLYAIPNRDCGGLSAGGLDAGQYIEWVQTIATALNGSNAVVMVEPDSLAMLTEKRCASETATRPALIREAVDRLAHAGLTVYLDGGNSNWVKPSKMAELLESAGVAEARGFFTNVSNFYRVDQERAYGDTLSGLLGDKHFVVDVSRNGNGWKGTWCNPSGAALGQSPHVSAGTTKLDALLWVKHPGDSDGTCNGGPKAGEWWPEYALDLVRNSAAG